MIAQYSGQCTICQRKIHEGDSIYWARGEGAAHESCSKGEEPPENRRRGSAAQARPMDLPKYETGEDEGPVDWETYKPRKGA